MRNLHPGARGVKAGRRELTCGILDEMRQIEFTRIDYDEEASPYYGYVKGSIPILISAPHGAKHYRAAEGKWRDEDAYTSSLAMVLGRLTGAHVLYVLAKTTEDPNNDVGTAYKEAMKKIVEENGIGFVLDLHGADGRRPFKVDFGIMHAPGPSCSCPSHCDAIGRIFAGPGPLFNQHFSARGEGTITCFARKGLGIESAQLEINANYRIVEGKSTGFKADPRNILDLVGRLRGLIQAINGEIAQRASGGHG
ncbi:MAG: hypothetical protein ABSC19_03055 [Syntrophorhabdales bacterium]|jgi:hypothetical protein